MRRFTEKLERIFIAAAYAEAGEEEMAREILMEEDRVRKVERISPTVRARKELRAPGIKR